MKLCISTLACPTWTLQQIVDFCANAGVQGIDFRGIASEIDITRLPQFTTDLYQTLQLFGERNLVMPCLNLSVTLVTPDEQRWTAFLEEATRYATLAEQTHTKYLRVFGGAVPKEFTLEQARDLAIRHLRQLVKIAKPRGVTILVETHDAWSTGDEVMQIVGGFSPDEVGVLWDFEHSYRKGEPLKHTAQLLKRYIRHTHVKDYAGDERHTPTLLGEGVLPIAECVQALKEIDYHGWYCLEAEKRWRAETPEPEITIPQFIEYMTKLDGK